MSDATARLNAALEGRYAIERELGESGNWAVEGGDSGDLTDPSGVVSLARPPTASDNNAGLILSSPGGGE